MSKKLHLHLVAQALACITPTVPGIEGKVSRKKTEAFRIIRPSNASRIGPQASAYMTGLDRGVRATELWSIRATSEKE